MADTEGGDMSRQSFQVAYDGEVDTHSMDVQELAPALLALGKLVREANAELNGKRATVKVLVQSDFEHKCFQINFEVVQSILDITDTNIAREAIARGGALINDLYRVKLQITQHLTKGGAIRPEFKILQVIDFREAPQQRSLPLS